MQPTVSCVVSFGLSLVVVVVESHSWAHCTDYDGTITGQDYSESLCNGYLPGWEEDWQAPTFSQNVGLEHQSDGPDWCQRNVQGGYTDDYPMATWNYDDTITIVWPAKNHANYDCFGNIPDTAMKLYYYPQEGQNYPTTSNIDDANGWELLIDWQEGCTPGTEGCGFQNCPDFCANTDGGPCFQKYVVQRNQFPTMGVYWVMWYWIFDADDEPYVTCFQVEIGNDTVLADDSDDSANENDQNLSKFIVVVPICIQNAMYDLDLLLEGATNTEYHKPVSVDWYLKDSVSGDESSDWEVKIETVTSLSYVTEVTEAAYDFAVAESALCNSIEVAFGNGSICTICDLSQIFVYTYSGNETTNGTATSDDTDNTVPVDVSMATRSFLHQWSQLLAAHAALYTVRRV